MNAELLDFVCVFFPPNNASMLFSSLKTKNSDIHMAKRSEKKYQFWSSQLLTVSIKFHLVSDYGKGSFSFKVVVLPTLPYHSLQLLTYYSASKKLHTTACPSIGDWL